MSKILKRPMFRRGGEVGGGIMSGIQKRTNLATAGFLPEKNPEMGGSSVERWNKMTFK
jgi:heterodisulfide reductase subunit A-like polyferredoxin